MERSGNGRSVEVRDVLLSPAERCATITLTVKPLLKQDPTVKEYEGDFGVVEERELAGRPHYCATKSESKCDKVRCWSVMEENGHGRSRQGSGS